MNKLPAKILAALCSLTANYHFALAQVAPPPMSNGTASPSLPSETNGALAAPTDSVPNKPSSQNFSMNFHPSTESHSRVFEKQLTLSAAIAQALRTQPTLHQAKAQTRAAEGRVEQARSGYLPQITGIAGYQRTTGNYVMRPGAIPTATAPKTSYRLTNTYDFFNVSMTASQLIYDFGQTSGRWNAAEGSVNASMASEDAMRFQAVMNVQSAFYQGWAQRALVTVAEETLLNQQRHLEQIAASVKVGVRPDIDLAQARANVANARVQSSILKMRMPWLRTNSTQQWVSCPIPTTKLPTKRPLQSWLKTAPLNPLSVKPSPPAPM